MQKTANQYFIITTMDGIPVMSDNNVIMQYTSTESMRNNAKYLTFTTGQRHHTRGLHKDQRYRAKKHFDSHGFIPLGLLQ